MLKKIFQKITGSKMSDFDITSIRESEHLLLRVSPHIYSLITTELMHSLGTLESGKMVSIKQTKTLGEPLVRTVGTKDDTGKHMLVTRFGVFFDFETTYILEETEKIVHGAISVVAHYGKNESEHTYKLFVDLNKTIKALKDEGEDLLRLYEIE